ncbi:TPA: hypothetical protein HA318_05335 [Candidatus Micrarchaeota archaeon]|nr:hypothetical protein [Candidatus Micrarchaeota archaeon]
MQSYTYAGREAEAYASAHVELLKILRQAGLLHPKTEIGFKTNDPRTLLLTHPRTTNTLKQRDLTPNVNGQIIQKRKAILELLGITPKEAHSALYHNTSWVIDGSGTVFFASPLAFRHRNGKMPPHLLEKFGKPSIRK